MTDSHDASDSSEYEFELTGGRDEIVDLLEGVVDGVVTGAIQLGTGTDAVSVAFPDDLSLEIEFEDDGTESSLELELEWPTRDAPSEDATTHDTTDEPTIADPTDTDHPTDTDPSDANPTNADPTDTDPTNADPTNADPIDATLATAADGSESLARFEVFRDRGDQWRWRLRHRNGNIIAVSGEGYTRKHNAEKGLRSVVENSPDAEITDSSTD